MNALRFWLDNLTSLQWFAFYILALPATVIILLQTVLTLFGFIGNADASMDSESSDGIDLDGDGISDVQFGVDLDGDGIPDIFPESFDFDNDGIADFTTNLDGDGIPEMLFGIDLDGDGIPDILPDSFSLEDIRASTDDHIPENYNNDTMNNFINFASLVTQRGIVAFFAVTGWFILGFTKMGISIIISIGISVFIGFIVMITIGFALSKIKKMDHDGTIKHVNTIGLNGDVYLRIPGNFSGIGKVNVLVQERYAEFSAATFWKQDINTGEKVKIVGANKDGVLLVEPKKPQIKE